MTDFNMIAAQGRRARGEDFGCSQARLSFVEASTGTITMAGSAVKTPAQSGGTGTELLEKTDTKIEKPKLYKVVLINDDYTPMEFVVDVLQRFFGHDKTTAEALMMLVHTSGTAVVGVYNFQIAETKQTQTMDYARKNEHPLRAELSPA